MSVASACATLETIPLQACGNHVTETSEGEDCDGLPEGSPFTCGDPGSDHECKYVWTSENESCPDSYVKSLDGRCRKPSLTFEAAKAYNLPGEQPQIGDIDADGTDEIGLLLRGLGPDNAGGQFVLTSLDGVGTTFASFPIGKSALLGDLSGDGLTDVVFPTEPGFSVMLSREGELSLKVYTAKLPDQTLGLFPLPVWLAGDIGENLDLSLLGAMVQGSNGPELCLGDQCLGVDTKPHFASTVEHWVRTATGRTSLDYVPRAGYGSFPPSAPTESYPLTLAGPSMMSDTVAAQPAFVDLDGNGALDLAVLVQSPSTMGLALQVLEGSPSGNGYFAWPPVTTLRRALTGLGTVLADDAWAIGDANGDGSPDLVVGQYVYVSKGPFPSGTDVDVRSSYDRVPWSRSGPLATADVNADGLSDFVSVVGGRVQVLLGGDFLPLVHYELEGFGVPTRLGVVDFDGDGADDLFVGAAPTGIESGELRGCDEVDDLLVAYGRSGAFPSDYEAIAALPPIAQITADRFLVDGDFQDGFGDAIVWTKCKDEASSEEAEIAFLVGNSRRALFAPYTIVEGTDSKFQVDSVATTTLVESDDATIGTTTVDVVAFGGTADGVDSRAYLLPTTGEAEILDDDRVIVPLPPEHIRDAPSLLMNTGDRLAIVSAADLDGQDDVSWSFILLSHERMDTPDGATLIEVAREARPLARPEGATGSPSLTMVSALLNDDDYVDFVAVARFDLEASAGYDGGPGDDPMPTYEGSAGVLVTFLSGPDESYTAALIDLSDLFIVPVSVVKMHGEIVIVSTDSIYSLAPDATSLEWRSSAGLFNTKGAITSDFNGDDLEDLLVIDGEVGLVLEQLPFETTDGGGADAPVVGANR
ncbi:MAG: VCBS repeat-containing protein [Polyangiaceae bacterium]|nr:VCBS repeat-containing protein [Polyangiaceae bacterium]